MSKKFSLFIFNILENKANSSRGKFFENFLFFLIFTNVLASIIETLPSLQIFSSYFLLFEIFSLSIFLIEYLFRISTCHYKEEFSGKFGKIGFVFSPMMIFDAFVLFPSIVSIFFPALLAFDARILRIIRTFRIIRISEYSKSIRKIIKIIGTHKKDLISAFFLIFIGIFILSTLMFYAEKNAQPEAFKSIPHAIYWGLITVSTIGYGDITPVTKLGKILTSIGALLGVAVYALPSALLGAAFYAEAQSKEAAHVSSLEQEVAMLRKKLKRYESKRTKQSSDENEDDSSWKIIRWMKNQ